MPAPKKSLGQNFLINEGVCEKIAGLLDLGADDLVLEIGPGKGALTRRLLPRKKLLLLEKDWDLARDLAQGPDCAIINTDALTFAWQKLSKMGSWKIAGNLPYNVASPLIWNILPSNCFSRLVFMVQKEVGERLTASPGTKKYGALSVWAQAHARPHYEFTVKPGSFYPRPKVDSAVISFSAKTGPRPDSRNLAIILNLLFQQRRKQLGSILKNAGLWQKFPLFESQGIKSTMRPEEIGVEIYERLAEGWQSGSD